MKQLIHTADSHLIVGFGDRAFVVPQSNTDACRIFELVDPEHNDGEQAPAVVYSEENGEIKPREIQAVAVAVDTTGGEEGGSLWCAVARYNKSLALYHVPITASSSSSTPIQIQPKLIHKTTKRASCLTFSNVENALQVVIAGDLAGDAVAFSLQNAGAFEAPTPATPKGTIAPDARTEKESSKDDQTTAEVETNRYKRLLLGHTASMLTGVQVTVDHGIGRILTCDRDEKIRVSLFPDTHVVESFLLGHEAFVSSLDVTHKDGLTRCASSSGDGTIRLWDYAKGQELAVTSVADGDGDGDADDSDERQEEEGEDGRVPSRVAIHPDGASVAVIYDECVDLDIYSDTNDNGDGGQDDMNTPGELRRSSRTACAAQPLGLAMLDAQTIVVVTKDPTYIQAFRVEKDGILQVTDLAFCQALRDFAVQDSVDMPATILEKDKQGNVKMQKLSEQRSSVEDKPWNNKGRIDIARERTKRSKRRKREKQEESTKATLLAPEGLPVPPS